MNLDDDLCLLQAMAQARDLALELCDATGLRRRLRPPLERAQTSQRSIVPLSPPVRQQRRVQTLPPKQGTDLARAATPFHLAQDPDLVLRREPPTRRLRRDLRVWRLRLSRSVRRRVRPLNFDHLVILSPALLQGKFRRTIVSRYVDTQGISSVQAPVNRAIRCGSKQLLPTDVRHMDRPYAYRRPQNISFGHGIITAISR